MNTNRGKETRMNTNSVFGKNASCSFVHIRVYSWKNLFVPRCIILSVAMVCLGTGCKERRPVRTEILVAAAASLQRPLTAIAAEFRNEHPDIAVNFTFGGSGTLLQQVLNGAPVDVYITADPKQMDTLRAKKFLRRGYPKALIGNTLVLVQRLDRSPVKSLEELATDRMTRIALGEPRSVPAGMYAEQSLANAGISDLLAGKKVYANDVRQVLTYVETGAVDAGFVYGSDAQSSANARIAFVIPESFHEPIRYYSSVLSSTEHASESETFEKYLRSESARAIFQGLGFTPIQ